MTEFRVKGAEDFYKLSKALKAAGRTTARVNLNKGLRAGARPLIGDARAAARRELPSSGGLADRVAASRFRVQVRTGAQTAGVRVVADGQHVAAKQINNRGIFRHPVFADKKEERSEWTWVNQATGAKGWFDRAMRKGAPKVRPELARAIEKTLNDIVKGV